MAPIAGTQIPTVGDQPFQEASQLQVNAWKKIFNSQLGANNPLWNDEIELSNMKALGFVTTPVNVQTSINERFSKRYPVADLNLPRDPIAVVQVAERYTNDNPFVAKAVRVKTDFTVKNFQHKTHNKPAKEFYDKKAKDLRIWQAAREIVFRLYSVGIAPVWWGGEEGPIDSIFVLDPKVCYIRMIMGKPKLWLKIDDDMIQAVRDPEGKLRPENKAKFESMPKYWIRQIKQYIDSGQTLPNVIELKDGSYTVIQNRYIQSMDIRNSLTGCPLQPAFDALQRYRLLAAGDFAMAWNVKNMITLISEGDPKADKDNFRPADTARLLNLQKAFSSPDYSLQVFCDATTRVEYVIPPLDAFKTVKYWQPLTEIKVCLNLPSFMWGNSPDVQASNYSGAIAELMLLREEVDAIRTILQGEFFDPFYSRLRDEASRPGFAEKNIPAPSFDKNSLRDDAIWLEAMTQFYGTGGLSLRSLGDVFGVDYEYEMEELKKEHQELGSNVAKRDNPTTAQPIFEPSQGNQTPTPPPAPGGAGAKGGRPRTSAKKPTTSTRSPRSTGK